MPNKALGTEIFRQFKQQSRSWEADRFSPQQSISFLSWSCPADPTHPTYAVNPKISHVGCNKRRRMEHVRCSSGAVTGRQTGNTVWNGKSVTQRWGNKCVVTFGSLRLMNRADQTSAAASLSSGPQFWALRHDSPGGQDEAEGAAKNGAPKFYFPAYGLLIFSCIIYSLRRS